MAKKGPALYELIQQQHQRTRPTSVVTRPAAPVNPPPPRAQPPAPPAPPPARPAPAPAPQPTVTKADTPPPGEHNTSWLSQGKTYRIPAGYIAIAIVLFVAVAIGAFSTGVAVTNNQHEAEKNNRERDQVSNITDPTLTQPNRQPATTSHPQTTPSNSPQTAPSTRSTPVNAGANQPIDLSGENRPANPQNTAATGAVHGIKLGPGDLDPRFDGQNYYILASFLQTEEADRAVDFFAANGVAVMRLAPNNRGLCTLVALKGFPPGDTSSQRARDYKATLLRLGREYKRNHRGGTDFSDLYLKKQKP